MSKYLLASLCLTFLMSACSPVNSVAPFDDKQAATVARDMMPRK